jgi:hypothetical protein
MIGAEFIVWALVPKGLAIGTSAALVWIECRVNGVATISSLPNVT